jgi:lysozyme
MRTSDQGIKLLKYYESCRLEAYPDPATGGDPWTIGYGDTGPDVVPGLVISQEEAEQRLARRMADEFEPAMAAILTKQATQSQWDALVCWVFNVGPGAAAASTLIRHFNADEPPLDVAAQFLRWDKAAGKSMWGLRRRRAAERMLYLGATAEQAISIGDKTL